MYVSFIVNNVTSVGRAGVPMEVMGLMLGQFVDDYTITCVDVFAMPQVSSLICCHVNRVLIMIWLCSTARA